MQKLLVWLVGMACGVCAASAFAQADRKEFDPRFVAKAWAVYGPTEQEVCWIFSVPTSTVNTRDGKPADQVKRGEIGLFVGYEKKVPHVAFSSGYPMRKDTATITVGSEKYILIPGDTDFQQEWAWTRPQDDVEVIEMMKKSNQAVVNAVSTRGTNTKDTFSLLGFTAAYERMVSYCS